MGNYNHQDIVQRYEGLFPKHIRSKIKSCKFRKPSVRQNVLLLKSSVSYSNLITSLVTDSESSENVLRLIDLAFHHLILKPGGFWREPSYRIGLLLGNRHEGHDKDRNVLRYLTGSKLAVSPSEQVHGITRRKRNLGHFPLSWRLNVLLSGRFAFPKFKRTNHSKKLCLLFACLLEFRIWNYVDLLYLLWKSGYALLRYVDGIRAQTIVLMVRVTITSRRLTDYPHTVQQGRTENTHPQAFLREIMKNCFADKFASHLQSWVWLSTS